jgi:hypothetical protein
MRAPVARSRRLTERTRLSRGRKGRRSGTRGRSGAAALSVRSDVRTEESSRRSAPRRDSRREESEPRRRRGGEKPGEPPGEPVAASRTRRAPERSPVARDSGVVEEDVVVPLSAAAAASVPRMPAGVGAAYSPPRSPAVSLKGETPHWMTWTSKAPRPARGAPAAVRALRRAGERSRLGGGAAATMDAGSAIVRFKPGGKQGFSAGRTGSERAGGAAAGLAGAATRATTTVIAGPQYEGSGAPAAAAASVAAADRPALAGAELTTMGGAPGATPRRSAMESASMSTLAAVAVALLVPPSGVPEADAMPAAPPLEAAPPPAAAAPVAATRAASALTSALTTERRSVPTVPETVSGVLVFAAARRVAVAMARAVSAEEEERSVAFAVTAASEPLMRRSVPSSSPARVRLNDDDELLLLESFPAVSPASAPPTMVSSAAFDAAVAAGSAPLSDGKTCAAAAARMSAACAPTPLANEVESIEAITVLARAREGVAGATAASPTATLTPPSPSSTIARRTTRPFEVATAGAGR